MKIMKKLDITKKGTGIFQGKKNPAFSKATGWPLLIGLLLMLITASAFVTAGGKTGTHPEAKLKSVAGKSHGTALPTGAPTISYAGPQVYQVGQAVSLTPGGSGVAPLAYGTTGTPYGGHFKQPGSLVTDAAGNLYVSDPLGNYTLEIPAGNGTPKRLAFTATNGIAVDGAGNFYVSDREVYYSFFPEDDESDFNTVEDVYKIPADSIYVQNYDKYQQLLQDQQANDVYGDAYGVAVSAAGNLFVTHADCNLQELPAGGSKFKVLYQTNPYLTGAIACDANGDVFFANGKGITEVPAGNGAPGPTLLLRLPAMLQKTPAIALKQVAAVIFT